MKKAFPVAISSNKTISHVGPSSVVWGALVAIFWLKSNRSGTWCTRFPTSCRSYTHHFEFCSSLLLLPQLPACLSSFKLRSLIKRLSVVADVPPVAEGGEAGAGQRRALHSILLGTRPGICSMQYVHSSCPA